MGVKNSGHRQGQQAVSDASAPSLGLIPADARHLGIGVHAVGHQAVHGRAAASVQVIVDDAEIVEGRVGELGAARALAHCPYARRRGGKAYVNRDVARLGQLHPGLLQPDTAGVRRTADADKQVSPFDNAFAVRPLRDDVHVAAGFSFDAPDLCLEVNGDPLVVEELEYRRPNVGVFAAGQLLPVIDDGHTRAEAAHGLRQLQPDIAAADDDQMLRQAVEVEQFNVGHRPGGSKTGNVRQGREGAKAIGGVRDWDYRYCWLRYASFTLRALLALGYREEAEAYIGWLLHATRLTWPELQVLYNVFGEARLPEQELPHLEGYAGSRPVRIGNDAQGQLQLDVYGEVINGAARFLDRGGRFDRDTSRMLDSLGRTVCRRWREPDEGIWEGAPADPITPTRRYCAGSRSIASSRCTKPGTWTSRSSSFAPTETRSGRRSRRTGTTSG